MVYLDDQELKLEWIHSVHDLLTETTLSTSKEHLLH